MNYMNEFFAALIAALARVGISNVNHPYNGCDYITVAGCYFRAELARSRVVRTRGAIVFERWKFFRPYKMDKVVELVLKALPEKLVELKQQQEQSKRYEEGRQINKAVAATKCLSVYSIDDGRFAMSFKHSDRATIMAAIDYLQDGGFCDDCPPTTGEEDFTESQEQRTINAIHKLLDSLKPERKRQLAIDLHNTEVFNVAGE